MTIISNFKCACGEVELFALRPGVEPLKRGAVDLFSRMDQVVDRGEPDECWCMACWLKRFGKAAA